MHILLPQYNIPPGGFFLIFGATDECSPARPPWKAAHQRIVDHQGTEMDEGSSERPLRSVPSIKLSLALYGMTVVLMLIMGVVLMVSGVKSMRFCFGLEFLAQWAFMFFPIVFVLRAWRYDLYKSLNLNVPEGVPLIGTLLVAPSSCIILHQMLAWQMSILPMPDELNALVEGVRGCGQTKTGFAILFALAAFSAPICEELLFRGILFSSLRRRLKPVPLVIVVAMLFSFYHLHPYRMILIFPLGVVLTYVVLRSGSIYLSMLCHFIVNTLSLVLMTRLHEVCFPAIRYNEEQGFSVTIIVATVFFFVVGVVLLEQHARGPTNQSSGFANARR
ncbi:MAG: CPBP family intramembrane metalloprotease [Phycisphaerales bacterium]|nr:MAG: CPBP family intramembrane metalloprotease [Phycisphaerales bacterium]